ncbi:MAG: hypothetical protein HYW49_04690 [Deltaproteobacteria bacterium]|nr:hypothetical protein [Deltaproteobacteria bacterium]
MAPAVPVALNELERPAFFEEPGKQPVSKSIPIHGTKSKEAFFAITVTAYVPLKLAVFRYQFTILRRIALKQKAGL